MKTAGLVSLSLFNVTALAAFFTYVNHKGQAVSEPTVRPDPLTRNSPSEAVLETDGTKDSYSLTALDLPQLRGDFDRCLATLENLDIEYEVLGDQRRRSCSLTQQVSLTSGQIDYAVPFQATCTMIAAIALWEEQAVQQSAREYLGEEIARIHHYGSFSCRPIRRDPSNMSAHASGSALDVSAFETVSGRMIAVYGNWDRQDSVGQFLHAIRDRSCEIFPGVLGPDYNYDHRNHFHLEYTSRRHRVCD
ncbi:MAG: hypothetical protein CMH32_04075 [Micavibrio sp.]|nr:hypothetical protein [Micavibrio sp.]HCK32754.1 hypothetical protein [Rhodospirillaceae bacterium]|tara:strand:+ start:2370 stop:3113 length:744 start_codon:yes stop_codon:yes gene_type:complete